MTTATTPLTIAGVELELSDVRHGEAREYAHFFADRNPAQGPGWYVFGRTGGSKAGEGVIKVCARPDVPARAHPHYNIRVRRGWHTRTEALAIAASMNSAD